VSEARGCVQGVWWSKGDRRGSRRHTANQGGSSSERTHRSTDSPFHSQTHQLVQFVALEKLRAAPKYVSAAQGVAVPAVQAAALVQ